MRKIFYMLILLISFLPLKNVKAACSGAGCCTITSGVVTAPIMTLVQYSHLHTALRYMINIYAQLR